jgi:hypothetical protein
MIRTTVLKAQSKLFPPDMTNYCEQVINLLVPCRVGEISSPDQQLADSNEEIS